MSTLIRLPLIVAVVLLLAVCLFGLPHAYDSANLRRLIRETLRGEELQRFRRFQHCRRDAREYLVQEVIAQRCSLSETLARWQKQDRKWLEEVNRECPNCSLHPTEEYRQRWLSAELNYLSIIEITAYLLRDQPKEKAAVLRRLERDYQQLQAGQRTPSRTAATTTAR